MHILFLTHYFPPEGNAPASRTYENCKRWVSTGHHVTVITCAPNVPSGVVYAGYKNKLYQREVMDGADVVRVWTYLAPNKGIVRRTINYLSYMLSATVMCAFVKKVDLVVATSPQFFCGWAGVFVSKLKRRPLLLEIRDIWPDSFAGAGFHPGGVTERILCYLEKKMYDNASHIVTVGEGYKRVLTERKGIKDSDISVVTNGANIELYFPREPDEELKRHYGLDGFFVCSYIGTIAMSHGLSIVLRAARILKDTGRLNIKFLLVGDGALRESLENKACRLGLDNVIFTGLQDKHTTPKLYSISDASLVHLKNFELFKTVLPSKIFETLAMAKPIILGVQGCAADLVNRAHAGICIEPENEKALVDAIERLANNPALAEELGRAGHEYITKFFNLDFLAHKYLGVIEQVIKKPVPKPAKHEMAVLNGFSIDVEDWFHILDSPFVPDIEQWGSLESHVEANIETLLGILDETGTRATMFWLGWVAERHPDLVRLCQKEGHEIASHGYAHVSPWEAGPVRFREDIDRAKKTLEDITGKEVCGFRTPGFGISERAMWAFDVISDVGYKYDSSVASQALKRSGAAPFQRSMLVSHKLGQKLSCRNGLCLIETKNGLLTEVFITPIRLLGLDVGLLGGGYLRLVPSWFLRRTISQLRKNGNSVITYIHPREIDIDQPRLQMGLIKNVKTYINIKSTVDKLRILCSSFDFTPIGQIVSEYHRTLECQAITSEIT